jgi:hypothetical protein
MVIKFIYGENDVAMELDTSFSLSFLSKMMEQKLIGKDFLKSIAEGKLKIDEFDDFFNIPYCCYLNGTKDPMTKKEFDERWILDVPLMRNIYQLVIYGNGTDSKMKNVFRVPEDPKTEVKGPQTSGRE